MTASMLTRLRGLVQQVLGSYQGAWLVWCDPRGDWLPLLRRVASDPKSGEFDLLEITEETAGEPGGPSARRALQARLEAGGSFVLHVAAPRDNLGWLWAQALLAERVYSRSLREQLVEWGWRPHSLAVGDDELAALARQNADRDPADWGGGGLQPDLAGLLEVLAAGAEPDPDRRLVLDLTVEQAGLPPLDEGDLQRWRRAALARLLVAQAHQVAPEAVPEGHELLIAPGQRPLALKLLEGWADSLRLGRSLPEAILEADRLAGLGSLAAGAGIGRAPFLSQAAENAVFVAACSGLACAEGKELLEGIADLAESCGHRAAGFWGQGCAHPLAVPWGELLRLGRAARALLDASPKTDWAAPDAAISWYVSGGWRLDQAGEEMMRSLDRPVPELLALIEPLRAAYRARWEHYMLRWSELWESAGCAVPNLGTAGEWAAELLRASRPTAILFLDALRYDLGVGLADRINRQEGTERAVVSPARAPLPSVTGLGMGAALPIPERDLEADVVEGKWRLFQRGRGDVDLSVAARRRSWLQEHAGVPEEGFITLAALLSGSVPQPAPGSARLVVADDAIDRLGHDDQLEMQGSGSALERYAAAVARLRDAGWLRILAVTDHGFIQWTSSEEKSIPAPAPNPAYSSRRALAYPRDTAVPGPKATAPGGRWLVAVPRGVASFKAYGGLGYFHGGASLQEWIIPCVKIEWPLRARPVEVAVEALPQILGQRPRVTLRVIRSSLLIDESIPRQVDVVVRDARQNTILFRSEPVSVTPDQHAVAVTVPAVEGAAAERGTALRIEVRDKRDDEVITSGPSVLMTELTGW